MDNLSDEGLVDRLRAGDKRALGLIYSRYKRALYAFCVRLVVDDAQAQDAVHETFLKLYTAAAGIRNGGALKTWLYRTARNESLQFIRLNGRREATDAESLWIEETPLSILDESDSALIVRNGLQKLKAEYREVLLLREYDQMSYAQIADITGSTESSVKSRIFKARRALASRLAPWFSERSAG